MFRGSGMDRKSRTILLLNVQSTETTHSTTAVTDTENSTHNEDKFTTKNNKKQCNKGIRTGRSCEFDQKDKKCVNKKLNPCKKRQHFLNPLNFKLYMKKSNSTK